ncbi:MAG TPA: hypothetical protein VFA21_05655 [Pyrinomonadaceae bacterium]|jgi:hypothetical protein|nr:hypothetical protein [Pyrinomonadaceae bacterium]
MSDYLWDKTGARDAGVERLENLLGQLRHRPQPFALPDELTTTRTRDAAASGVEGAETNRARAGALAFPERRHVRTSWLAVAAVLLLAFVALALALLRTGATGGSQQSASQVGVENSQPEQHQSAGIQTQNGERQAVVSPTADVAQTGENVAPSYDNVTTATVTRKPGAQPAVVNVARETQRKRQSALKERQPTLIAKGEQPQPALIPTPDAGGSVTRAAQSSGADDLPLKTQLAAKEQLMYALRLTSSKLSEVRAKTLGLGDAKRGFVEGNRNK